MCDETEFLLWSDDESEVELPTEEFSLVDSPSEAMSQNLSMFLTEYVRRLLPSANDSLEKLICILDDEPIYLHLVTPGGMRPYFTEEEGVSSLGVIGELRITDYCELPNDVCWLRFQYDARAEHSNSDGAVVSAYLRRPRYEEADVLVACVSVGLTHLVPVLEHTEKMRIAEALLSDMAINVSTSWVRAADRFVLLDWRKIGAAISMSTVEEKPIDSCVIRERLRRLIDSVLEEGERFWISAFHDHWVVIGTRKID